MLDRGSWGFSKERRDYGTYENNETDRKNSDRARNFRVFRYFRMFRNLSSACYFPVHAKTSGFDAARHNRTGLLTEALASVLPSGEKTTTLT